MNKIIGVCATRVQGEMCRTFLKEFQKCAEKNGYTICVFQSVYDFDEENVSGAAYVYSVIPYEKLSALVLVHDMFYDKELLNSIIEGAISHQVPVISARKCNDLCYSLIGNYEAAYEKLLRKVIVEKNIQDVFYIAGRRIAGSDSNGRVAVFRKLMEELQIPFDDNKLAYGEYYEVPARKIVDELLASGQKLPQGIFCANDIMALAVIERLEYAGVRVPEDVVVTGFDGLETSKYSEISLTTCCEDMGNLAKLAIDVIMQVNGEGTAQKVFEYQYEPVWAKSTGHEDTVSHAHEMGIDIFRRFRLDDADEEALNAWIDQVMKNQTLQGLREALPEIVGRGRTILARQDQYWELTDSKRGCCLPDIVKRYTRDWDGNYSEEEADFKTAISQLLDSIPLGRMGYMSAISLNEMVFGLAFDTTSDPMNNGGRQNRFAVTIDRGFALAAYGEQQLALADQISRSRYVDSVTNALNIDGANKWFYNLVHSFENSEKYLSVGVFKLMNFKDIQERFGMEKLEDVLQYIAASLALANPDNCILARISADSFLVANLLNALPGGAIIDNSVKAFYGIMAAKQKDGDVWSGIEVSCGFFEDSILAADSLDHFANASISKLYRNRSSFEKSLPNWLDRTNGEAVLEFHSRFLNLLSRELFLFHFQPIVSVSTGEIVAYEALMRTTDEIKLNPLEVLEAADLYGKMYEVEVITFRKILQEIQQHREIFAGKKVFVNTIPGYFLDEKDGALLKEMFSDILPDIMIEITESKTVEATELERIRSFSGDGTNANVVVDDYGTGHSNIVNLLEYKPKVVKIDRYLVSNIQNDRNKQLFVKNLLEFAKENDILVLAEGVETAEEMKTVIGFGVDLLQGYYLGKPLKNPIISLTPKQVQEILDYHVSD